MYGWAIAWRNHFQIVRWQLLRNLCAACMFIILCSYDFCSSISLLSKLNSIAWHYNHTVSTEYDFSERKMMIMTLSNRFNDQNGNFGKISNKKLELNCTPGTIVSVHWQYLESKLELNCICLCRYSWQDLYRIETEK